jgi:hypothetical protein
MAHVTLIFEDEDNGQGGIAFKANFTGGEQKHSNAHKLANQVIHWLDEQASGKSQEVTKHVGPVEEVHASHSLILR